MSQSGFSLFELLLVLVIIAMMAMAAVPTFGDAVESTRMQRAEAELNSLWLAQRLHRLETGRFATSMEELATAQLIPGVEPGETEGFGYKIRRDALGGLRIVAQREPGSAWFGELSLDQLGELRGELRKSDGTKLLP